MTIQPLDFKSIKSYLILSIVISFFFQKGRGIKGLCNFYYLTFSGLVTN